MFVGLGFGVKCSKGGRLDYFTTEHHMDQSKSSTNDHRPAKFRLHILWRCVGRDVKVLGGDSEQKIADCATHEVGLEPCPLQGFTDLDRIGRDQLALKTQIGAPKDFGLTRFGETGSATQQSVEQSVDHSKSRNTGQPEACAASSRRGSGLVATGSVTCLSNGRSFIESL